MITMTTSRREFLEKSATLAALGFAPRAISYDEWLTDRERSRVADASAARAFMPGATLPSCLWQAAIANAEPPKAMPISSVLAGRNSSITWRIK